MAVTESPKQRKTDRIIVLKVKDGEQAKSSKGVIDPRLFSGENKLHGIMDSENLLWGFKYDAGGLPEPLKQKFTTFDRLLAHAKQYFQSRNIDIVEVID